jgi:hypothetical protein
MKKLLIAPLALLFFSCVSINTSIQLANNGSGQITLQYTVSQMVSNLGRVDSDWQRLPLPITEADFRRAVGQIAGLKLDSFSRKEDAQNITIDATLSFLDVSSLNQLYSPGGKAIQVTDSGGQTEYRQLIFEGFPNGVDQQSKSFADTFFKDYKLQFELKTPAPIKSANIGTVASNKRSVRYEIPITKLLDARTPIEWDVIW